MGEDERAKPPVGGKPTMVQISWKALVDKADPKRNEPKTAYIFSNGRKFKEK